jgi:DNA-binding NarL/FixJ family response regulator
VRESEVLRLLVQGKSNQEIAASLSIRPGTVISHVSSIRWKLGAATRVEIGTTAPKKGLVDIPADE